MAHLITTLGPRGIDELGLILPHEHVFVDLRTPDQPGHGEADPEDVVALMAPELERAKQAGISAIAECSTVGVGRRADIDRVVSEAAELPIVVPTGIYREPWVPGWALAASEDELYDWMLGELSGEIEGSGVQAGWIKLSAGDDGLTTAETTILRAAARAARETNAVIGSHTIRGSVVSSQLEIIEAAGHMPDRFIWIHTQSEPDFDLHLEIARRGAWIEYDAIGADDFEDESFIAWIQQILDADLGDRLLLSQDRGSYDPAQPGGGTPRLRSAGVDEATVTRLTHENPFRAFAR
jgi:phosphotriesterase-related protein